MNIKRWIYTIIMMLLLLFTTGCWDRIEINDMALITATAYDIAPGGGIRYSAQIMLPSAVGSKSVQESSGSQQKKSFIVETADGIDPGDAEKNIQAHFPRKLFRGHRRVIIIGEELARHGIGEILGSLTRDPQNRLRTNILVAKGSKGPDLLKANYPLERVPTEAMREMLSFGIGIEANIRDFLIARSSEGMQPIGVSIEPEAGKDSFRITGLAVFRDLQLVGYLDGAETEAYLWVAGKYKNGIVAATVPGNEGVFRVNMQNTKSKITPEIENNKINIKINGEGSIYASSANLDLSVPKNVTLAQEAVQMKMKNQVENTIKLVQEEYKTDTFGFGNIIYQANPKLWNKLKGNWDNIYSQAEVSVSVNLQLRMIGMAGLPLYLNENEVNGK